MLRPCTATTPMASPASLRFHGAGNARIAATSTIVASTPLHPASIETAKPLLVLCRTFPWDRTCGSNSLTMPALIAANVFVHGTTNQDCTQGVSSSPNSVACRPRNQRKKLTMGRNSTQFTPLPQYDAGKSGPNAPSARECAQLAETLVVRAL